MLIRGTKALTFCAYFWSRLYTDDAKCDDSDGSPYHTQVYQGETFVLCLYLFGDDLSAVNGLDHGVHDLIPDGGAERERHGTGVAHGKHGGVLSCFEDLVRLVREHVVIWVTLEFEKDSWGQGLEGIPGNLAWHRFINWFLIWLVFIKLLQLETVVFDIVCTVHEHNYWISIANVENHCFQTASIVQEREI